MAGKRKNPKLRIDGVYYTVKIYTPKGKRTSISFGHVNDRSEAKVYAAFAKWLDLFEQQPQKVLSFKNPYEAIEQIFNPTGIITVSQFIDKYILWAKDNMRPDRNGKENPEIRKIKRACRFLELYRDWPVEDFGPDELNKIQKALIKSMRENKKKIHSSRYQ